MKYLKHFLYFIFALNLAFHSPNLMAQDSEMGLTKLSAQDEKRYREILEKPIDAGALNTTKINSYIEKDNASHILGELKLREANLIEWAKIDAEGKANLRTFYSFAGNYEESIKLASELLKEPDMY